MYRRMTTASLRDGTLEMTTMREMMDRTFDEAFLTPALVRRFEASRWH